MNRKFLFLLLVIILLVTGCGKKELVYLEEQDNILGNKDSDIIEKREPLTDEEKKTYINKSNVLDYIPEDANYNLNFVFLKGEEIPEIICTYDTSGKSVDRDAKIFILSYNSETKEWDKIFQEESYIMNILGVLNTGNGKEIALYGKASDGTAGFIGVDIVKYDSANNHIKMDMISSSISYADYPEFIEEESLILFEGFSHNETYKWNGQNFEHKISEIVVDIVPDIEIHFTIEDGKPVFQEKNLFNSPMKVSKGDIIAFIQDDYRGGLDRFGSSDGLESDKKAKNYLTVTGDGELYVSMRINAEWYELPFLVISDYSPELLGKELIDEDFYIKTSDNRYLSLNSNLLELKNLLAGGTKTKVDVSPYDDNIVLYSLEKDGIIIYYYDNPSDKNFEEILDLIAVKGKEYSTYRGLKVGDNHEKVIELYGNKAMKHSEDGYTTYFYEAYELDNFMSLVITIEDKTNSVFSFNLSYTF